MPVHTLSDLNGSNQNKNKKSNNKSKDVESGDEDGYELKLQDPVWGGAPDGISSLRPMQVVGILLWPCFLFRGSNERQTLEKRVIRTWALNLLFFQVFMFTLTCIVGGFEKWSVNPMLGPPGLTLIQFGAKEAIRMKFYFHIFRFVTPIFLHGGIIHAFFNLYSQFRMGVFVEMRWGSKNFAIIYFASGVVGIMMSLIGHPDRIAVGASGALYGLMGAWLSDIIITWNTTHYLTRIVFFVQVVGYIVIGMLISIIVPMIDWLAHLGGLICGILLGIYLFADQASEWNEQKKQNYKNFSKFSVVALCTVSLLLFYVWITPDTSDKQLKMVGIDPKDFHA